MKFAPEHLTQRRYFQVKSAKFFRTPSVATSAPESGIEHDDYLQQQSRGSLTTPSIALRYFIFETFTIIDFISPPTKTITKNVYVRSLSERILLNSGYGTNFTCDLHKEWDDKIAARTVVNNFFKNEQKYTDDSVRQEKMLISKRDKERRSNYFCSKLFLVNIPIMV